MIENHADIIRLWPNCRTLANRIIEEHPETMSLADFRKLKKNLETARDRGNINQKYWKYLIRVGTIDFERGLIPNQVTADLLLDKQGK